MTEEELQQEMKGLNESLEKLSDPEKPLTKEEARRKHVLILRKEVLRRMIKAKEKKDYTQEISEAIDYSLLKSLGEKHPFLLHLIRTGLRWKLYF